MAYPQGGYPQQGGYGGQVEHPQGTMVLVLGILSLVVCGLIGPFAWVTGNKAKKEIDANPGRYSNASFVTIGRILGIIATVLWLLIIVFYVVVFVLIAAGSSTS
jgi:ABC-type Fe3+ transport system permease subunit